MLELFKMWLKSLVMKMSVVFSLMISGALVKQSGWWIVIMFFGIIIMEKWKNFEWGV